MSSILDDFQVLEVPRTFSIAEVKIMKNKIYMLSSGNNDTPVAEIRWTESYQGV